MPMTMPPETGGDFTPAPEGTHPARCYRVVDLGTQKTVFNDETKFQHKILLSWELPLEKMDDGRPFNASKRYTFSSHEKANFRKDLETWRGQRFESTDFGPGGFEVSKLLTVPCLLTITHAESSGRTYANVDAVVRLPRGMNVPALTNPPSIIGLEDDTWDQAVFDALPEGIQKVIKLSPEYAQLMQRLGGPTATAGQSAPPSQADLDDDIPF